jgi:hypothetical protein
MTFHFRSAYLALRLPIYFIGSARHVCSIHFDIVHETHKRLGSDSNALHVCSILIKSWRSLAQAILFKDKLLKLGGHTPESTAKVENCWSREFAEDSVKLRLASMRIGQLASLVAE